MPVITLEVVTDPSNIELDSKKKTSDYTHESNTSEDIHSGLHFLTENQDDAPDQDNSGEAKPRHGLLEYVIRHDGSVLCKFCGEVLKNRTLWYRHKYKLHVMPLNPSPLFQCEHCLVYFKSRKGYVGHLASRHSNFLLDASPVLSNSQLEAAKVKIESPTVHSPREVKQEYDHESAIPKLVPDFNTNTTNVIKAIPKSSNDVKKTIKINKAETPNEIARNEEKRSRDEKLVADIISRVRKECETQGYGGPARRGYSRRTTVMHST